MSYILMPILLGLLFGFGLYSVAMSISRWKQGHGLVVSDLVVGIVFIILGFYPMYKLMAWL